MSSRASCSKGAGSWLRILLPSFSPAVIRSRRSNRIRVVLPLSCPLRTAVAFFPKAAWLTSDQEKSGSGQSATPVYELRVYHTYEGKLDDLLRRFREHTTKLFEKHGIKNVAYWTPTDEPLKGKTLVYILAHPSREAATANWQAFRDDPEWQSVRDKSEANGKIVEKVDSTFLVPTDFSPKLL